MLASSFRYRKASPFTARERKPRWSRLERRTTFLVLSECDNICDARSHWWRGRYLSHHPVDLQNPDDSFQKLATHKNVEAAIKSTNGVAKLLGTKSGNGFFGRNVALPFLLLTLWVGELSELPAITHVYSLPYVLLSSCLPFFWHIGSFIWEEMSIYTRERGNASSPSGGQRSQV